MSTPLFTDNMYGRAPYSGSIILSVYRLHQSHRVLLATRFVMTLT